MVHGRTHRHIRDDPNLPLLNRKVLLNRERIHPDGQTDADKEKVRQAKIKAALEAMTPEKREHNKQKVKVLLAAANQQAAEREEERRLQEVSRRGRGRRRTHPIP